MDQPNPHPARVPFHVSRQVVQFAGDLSVGTLTRLREALGGSLNWAGERFGQSAGSKLAGGLGIAEGLKKTSETLRAAGDGTEKGLAAALEKTWEAFQTAFRAVDEAGDLTYRTLFQNVGVASVLGPSFDPLLKQEIELSFRANGRDISVEQAVGDFRASGLTEAVVLVPGLFCDETVWQNTGEANIHWADLFRALNIYPLCIRFHPGRHVSDNGRDLARLLQEFTDRAGSPLFCMTYSQGGLVLRSALYRAKNEKQTWPGQLRRVLLTASPDGGSYIEKIGFYVGQGLVAAPLLTLKLIGMVGNMRSDAMKDLSHGIIREEDWQKDDQFTRYFKDYYFGELDGLDAFQAFGMLSDADGPPSWVGDGVVEHDSLRLLSDTVYRTQANPDERVLVLPGTSHFQTLQNQALAEFATRVFRGAPG